MPNKDDSESPYYFEEYLIDDELQALLDNPNPINMHEEFWGDRLKRKKDNRKSATIKNIVIKNKIDDNGVEPLF